GGEFGVDLVERHGRGVDEARVLGAPGEQIGRHDRAGIEAHGTAREDLLAAHGDEIGGARPGADEVHGHGAPPLSASAQVAGPTAVRGATRRAAGPPAANAAASATDGTPISATPRSEAVTARSPAASRSACGTSTSGTPRLVAAAAIPGSPPFTAGAAMIASALCCSPARDSAASIAAPISSAEAPLRQPMPATIMASSSTIG